MSLAIGNKLDVASFNKETAVNSGNVNSGNNITNIFIGNQGKGPMMGDCFERGARPEGRPGEMPPHDGHCPECGRGSEISDILNSDYMNKVADNQKDQTMWQGIIGTISALTGGAGLFGYNGQTNSTGLAALLGC